SYGGNFPIDQYPAAATLDQWAQRVEADCTGDGILDVIAIKWHSVGVSSAGELAVWPGRGDGNSIVSGYTGRVPSNTKMVVADFNGDGRIDVFTASPTDCPEHWSGLDPVPYFAFGNAWLGRGDGTFYLDSSYWLDGIIFPTGIGTGDVDGNGLV